MIDKETMLRDATRRTKGAFRKLIDLRTPRKTKQQFAEDYHAEIARRKEASREQQMDTVRERTAQP